MASWNSLDRSLPRWANLVIIGVAFVAIVVIGVVWS